MSVEPFLFTTDPELVRAACDPDRPPTERAAAVVVDWERHEKEARQTGAAIRIGTDTQIGTDTHDDLARVRSSVDVPVVCRVNAPGPHTPAEIDDAVRLGADEVLVPMVREATDVELVLRHAGDRVSVGVMIETTDAVEQAARIDRLPISRAYVGLMDLALDRGTPSIFTALVDGTVERVREQVSVPFGFGGLTIPGRGSPIPTLLLVAEMARLECAFTFLRRSFIADAGPAGAAAGIGAIRAAADVAARRSAVAVQRDRDHLCSAVAQLDGYRSAGHPA